MNKLVLVKYAPEIFLKGLNRNKFEKKLKNNITKKLKDKELEITHKENIIKYIIKAKEKKEEIILK